jgi:hypothetical protein
MYNCDYQKIKYSIIIYNRGSQKKIKHLLKKSKNNGLQKPLGLLCVLSWNLMVLWFWILFKYLDPAVLSY